jgi:hypothetical protein
MCVSAQRDAFPSAYNDTESKSPGYAEKRSFILNIDEITSYYSALK